MTAAPSAIEPSRPDWQQIDHAVECPLCDYNLRGLSEPRCPECGYLFEWWEVLDPARQKHRYLFEHHPRRNLWSFWQTLIGGLRPSQFWTELNPAQPSRVGRLLLYATIIVAAIALPAALSFLIAPASVRGFAWYQTTRYSLTWDAASNFPWGVVAAALGLEWPPREALLRCSILSAALPVASYLLLMIFQGTMRRARVRQRHVLRSIIYSADVFIWPSLPLVVLVCVSSLFPAWGEALAWTALVSFPLLWVVMACRIGCAYQKYLRFNHAWATVLSVQFILILAWVLVGLGRWL